MNPSELQRTEVPSESLCPHCGERDNATVELDKLRDLWLLSINMQKQSAAELADKIDRLFREYCLTQKGVR